MKLFNEMKSDEFEKKRDPDTNVQQILSGGYPNLDFYKISTSVGIVMVLVSFVLIFSNFPFAYDVTALAWGSILISLGQFFHYKENMSIRMIQKIYLESEMNKENRNHKMLLLGKILPMLPQSGATLNEIEAFFENRDDETVNIKNNDAIHSREESGDDVSC